MLLRRGGDIVVKVVDHNRISVGGEVDVELEEERGDRAWCPGIRTQSQENVPARVREVEESLRR